MNLIVRKTGLGLDSLRSVIQVSGIPITLRNSQVRIPSGTGKLITWGYVSDLPQGYEVINTPRAVAQVSDKISFRRKLDVLNLCPKTVFNRQDAIRLLETHDVIIRPRNHSQGRNLFVVHANDSDKISKLDVVLNNLGSFYVSELIKKESEYRVFIAQGKVVWVAEKLPDDRTQVAWNVHQGGSFQNVRFGSWNKNVIKNSIESFNQSELDFGAVDVVVDSEGRAFTLEINTAPALTTPYRTECVAKVFKFLFNNDHTRLQIPNNDRFNWRDFVHPAIINEESSNETVNQTPTTPRILNRVHEFTMRPTINFTLSYTTESPSLFHAEAQRLENEKREEVLAYLRAGGYIE
jgi:hypothetical protein